MRILLLGGELGSILFVSKAREQALSENLLVGLGQM